MTPGEPIRPSHAIGRHVEVRRPSAGSSRPAPDRVYVHANLPCGLNGAHDVRRVTGAADRNQEVPGAASIFRDAEHSSNDRSLLMAVRNAASLNANAQAAVLRDVDGHMARDHRAAAIADQIRIGRSCVRASFTHARTPAERRFCGVRAGRDHLRSAFERCQIVRPGFHQLRHSNIQMSFNVRNGSMRFPERALALQPLDQVEGTSMNVRVAPALLTLRAGTESHRLNLHVLQNVGGVDLQTVVMQPAPRDELRTASGFSTSGGPTPDSATCEKCIR